MARPCKWYVAFQFGAVTGIYRGLAALKKAGEQSAWGFDTQLAAEEFAAWWGYDHAQRH